MATRGPEPKYPWDDWMDGKSHTIEQGTDFDCTPATMVQMLHRRARSRGMVVNTRTLGGSVIFAFEGEAEEEGSDKE